MKVGFIAGLLYKLHLFQLVVPNKLATDLDEFSGFFLVQCHF